MVNGPDYDFLESIEDLQDWWEVHGDAALAAVFVMDYELPVRILSSAQAVRMERWLRSRLDGNANVVWRIKAGGMYTLVVWKA